MRNLIMAVILGLALSMSSVAYSNPFLVCDTQTNVEEYVVVFDGVEEAVSYQEIVFVDGTYAFLKDLDGISEGNHSVSVYARNIWGQSISVPFSFTKSLPGDPSGIGLK